MKRSREESKYSLKTLFLAALCIGLKKKIFKVIQASIEERFELHHTLMRWNQLSDYKRLVWTFGYCICSRQNCNSRIQSKNNFSTDSQAPFGKLRLCKYCDHTPSNALNYAREYREQKAMEAGTKRHNCDTEDIFARWIQAKFKTYGWEVEILPEARLNDVLVRRKDWENDMWIGVQLKTDGAYHDDGTLKPDIVEGQKGKFSHCHGYVHSKHIQLLFGKFRKQHEEDEYDVTLWQMSANQAENASNSTIKVNMNNEIGYKCGKDETEFRQKGLSKDFQEFFDTCQHLYLDGKVWAYREAFLCIDERNNVCKEVALMIALSENKLIENAELEYPLGNAHIYDCFQKEKKYQCKSIYLGDGRVSLCHNVNGVAHIRYKEEDEFDSFIFGKLIHKENKYYAMYVVVEKNTALYYNKGSTMHLQYNNADIKQMLGSSVTGTRNAMYKTNSFPMQLDEIQPTANLPQKLLDIVCDHL